MVKAIKVMLIPNNVQKTKMFQYAGASRFAYNWLWPGKKKAMKRWQIHFRFRTQKRIYKA